MYNRYTKKSIIFNASANDEKFIATTLRKKIRNFNYSYKVFDTQGRYTHISDLQIIGVLVGQNSVYSVQQPSSNNKNFLLSCIYLNLNDKGILSDIRCRKQKSLR